MRGYFNIIALNAHKKIPAIKHMQIKKIIELIETKKSASAGVCAWLQAQYTH